MAGVPNIFGAASAPIPLSQLDANFNTTATLGNAAIGLGNVTTTVGNLTLQNATISSVSTPITVAQGGTGTSTAFTAGSVVFAGASGVYSQNNANFFWDNTNNRLGIGTSTPSYLLQALKNQAATTSISVDNNTGNSGANASLILHTGGPSSGDPFVYFYNEITDWSIGCDNSDSDKFKISKSSTLGTNDYFNIDSSGNVGIGTTSPNYVLQLNGVGAGNSCYLQITQADAGTANTDGLIIGLATGASPDAYIAQKENANLIFQTNSAERARITSGGFFKQSNSATYSDATNTYNEFNSNISNNPVLMLRAINASYTANSLEDIPSRSATSSYSFYVAAGGGGADIEFRLRGDGNAYADGTWNNNGADYAEFFESANGQALTLGATVVLDGNKVREATDQDPASAIIGVVRPKEPSKASMVIGNTAWNKWANKYLTDDFDRYIMEDHDVVEWEEQVLEREAVAAVEAVVDEEGNEVSPAVPAQEATYKTVSHSYESHNIPAGITVPADAIVKTHDDKGNKFQHYKLNPAWDKDAEYVNRENRPEWNIIGLLGQVKILKGQPVGDRWTKMRDVSATVEEWMIR